MTTVIPPFPLFQPHRRTAARAQDEEGVVPNGRAGQSFLPCRTAPAASSGGGAALLGLRRCQRELHGIRKIAAQAA